MMVRVFSVAVCGIHSIGALAFISIVSGCVSDSANVRNEITNQPPPLTTEQVALFERRTQREEELLSSEMTAEAAAEIALLHHPAVERALETLGMSGFDRLELAHVINPNFNGGRPPATIDTRIERSLSVNVMTWVIIPALAISGTLEERAARVQAADEIGALLFAARHAWVNAVATRQSQRYFEDVVVATEVGREIMESMLQVGNTSELEMLRAQALYADAVTNLTTMQLAAALARERLVQTLGLWGETAEQVQLPDRLPDLPLAPIPADGLEVRAVAQRFDVHVGRLEGLAGEAGVNARADIRTAWLAYRGAYDLARHSQNAIVPLAERALEERLKLYNGMLIGVLDLVVDATERINAVTVSLDAQRDFWLAEVDLQRAMSGVGVSALTFQAGAQGGYAPGAAYHVH
ncbi:MAG: TolC family protein [Candidatus Rariloculaceae bacterium]